MAITCLTKPLAEKLKKALKDKSLNLAEMFDMTSKQRRAEFEKVLPTEAARFVNQEFEKAMISQREDALKEWVKNTTEEKVIKQYGIVEKINDLKGKDILNNSVFNGLLEDLISDKLGINITSEEISQLIDKVDKLEETRKQNKEQGLDYYQSLEKELKEIDNINKFISSLNPSSRVKVLLSVVRRGAGMLARFASPILNIVSNTFWGTIGIAERRLRTLQIQGYNSKESYQLAFKAWKIYQKTGYDISRMSSIDDALTIKGERLTTTQGKGAIRAYGRMVEKYIFDPLYQAPDVVAAIFSFTDTARLSSSRIANSEGLSGEQAKKRALDIMNDAFLVDPKTDIGKVVRASAMANAFYYTYTNNSAYSEFALKTRELVNKIGNVGLGEALLPFMKTPANVQAAGLQLSGVAGYEAIKNVYQGYQEIKKGTGTGKEKLDMAIRSAVQLGLSGFITFLLLGLVDDDEYMPDYFTATDDEKDFAKQNNIPFNSVKIGNKYVSFDYFGPIAAPLKGALHARKYSRKGANLFVEYGKGVGVQLMAFPGVSDIGEWLDTSKKALSSEGSKDYIKKQFQNGVINFVWTTFVPAVLSDIAIAMDEYQRAPETEIETIMSKLPILREKVDIKINIFGDKIKTEGALMQFLSGARVKTPIDDDVFNELQNLLDTGYYPNIKDIRKSSQKVKLLKEALGEERFNDMVNEFGSKFRDRLEKEIQKPSYKKLTDEDKKKEIENLKNEILTKIVEKYGYKQAKKKAEK